MSLEIELGVGLVIILILNLFIMIYLVKNERERKRRIEEWENEVFNLYEKVQKKLEQNSGWMVAKLTDELNRVDENTQKRHNYLKKSYNDIADRIDLVEQTEKRVGDIQFQLERLDVKLNALSSLFEAAATSNIKASMEEPVVPKLDPEVQAIVDLSRQGYTAEEIAQKQGRAIPEIQLMLHLVSEQNKR